MAGRTVLRGAGALVSLGLVALWIVLVWTLFGRSDYRPAPAVFMLPILFFTLAISAGVAALKDEPVLMVLTGGLSLVPMGMFLLFLPGVARRIGILDVCMVALGVLLLRSGERAAADAT